MVDLQVGPFLGQVLGDEAAVALVGLGFAAEEAGVVGLLGGDGGFDGAGGD